MGYTRLALLSMVIVSVIVISGCTDQQQDLPHDDSAVSNNSEIIFVPYLINASLYKKKFINKIAKNANTITSFLARVM